MKLLTLIIFICYFCITTVAQPKIEFGSEIKTSGGELIEQFSGLVQNKYFYIKVVEGKLFAQNVLIQKFNPELQLEKENEIALKFQNTNLTFRFAEFFQDKILIVASSNYTASVITFYQFVIDAESLQGSSSVFFETGNSSKGPQWLLHEKSPNGKYLIVASMPVTASSNYLNQQVNKLNPKSYNDFGGTIIMLGNDLKKLWSKSLESGDFVTDINILDDGIVWGVQSPLNCSCDSIRLFNYASNGDEIINQKMESKDHIPVDVKLFESPSCVSGGLCIDIDKNDFFETADFDIKVSRVCFEDQKYELVDLNFIKREEVFSKWPIFEYVKYINLYEPIQLENGNKLMIAEQTKFILPYAGAVKYQKIYGPATIFCIDRNDNFLWSKSIPKIQTGIDDYFHSLAVIQNENAIELYYNDKPSNISIDYGAKLKDYDITEGTATFRILINEDGSMERELLPQIGEADEAIIPSTFVKVSNTEMMTITASKKSYRVCKITSGN